MRTIGNMLNTMSYFYKAIEEEEMRKLLEEICSELGMRVCKDMDLNKEIELRYRVLNLSMICSSISVLNGIRNQNIHQYISTETEDILNYAEKEGNLIDKDILVNGMNGMLHYFSQRVNI